MLAVTASSGRILKFDTPELCRLRLSQARSSYFLKMKILGAEYWRISIPYSMQSGDRFKLQRTVVKMVLCTFPSRAGSMFATSGGTGRSARLTSIGSTMIGTTTTGSPSSAIFFILPLSFGNGSFFFRVSYPSPKHSSCFVERLRQRNILFIINDF